MAGPSDLEKYVLIILSLLVDFVDRSRKYKIQPAPAHHQGAFSCIVLGGVFLSAVI